LTLLDFRPDSQSAGDFAGAELKIFVLFRPEQLHYEVRVTISVMEAHPGATH